MKDVRWRHHLALSIGESVKLTLGGPSAAGARIASAARAEFVQGWVEEHAFPDIQHPPDSLDLLGQRCEPLVSLIDVFMGLCAGWISAIAHRQETDTPPILWSSRADLMHLGLFAQMRNDLQTCLWTESSGMHVQTCTASRHLFEVVARALCLAWDRSLVDRWTEAEWYGDASLSQELWHTSLRPAHLLATLREIDAWLGHETGEGVDALDTWYSDMSSYAHAQAILSAAHPPAARGADADDDLFHLNPLTALGEPSEDALESLTWLCHLQQYFWRRFLHLSLAPAPREHGYPRFFPAETEDPERSLRDGGLALATAAAIEAVATIYHDVVWPASREGFNAARARLAASFEDAG